MAVVSHGSLTHGQLVGYFNQVRKRLTRSGFTQLAEDRFERPGVTVWLHSMGRGKCLVEFEYLD